jgi:hypothetical protein
LNISPPLKAFLLKHGAAAYRSTFHLAKELSMTSLRQRMIEDMQIRNLAARECPIARRPPGLIYHRGKQGNAFWLRAATIIGRVFVHTETFETNGLLGLIF